MKWDVILMLCAYSFTSRYIKAKNRASSRLLAQNRVSQVFWEPIKNRATPRSALLKAVYLEALLYFIKTKWQRIALAFWIGGAAK